MSTIRRVSVSIVKTALVVVALAAPGRSTMEPTTSPTWYDDDYTYDDDHDWPNGFNATTAPVCEGSTPDFRDEYGDSCRWYERNDFPGCPEEGDLYAGPMGTAREHCCYCWMDAPTSAPTISTSPTLTPAPTNDDDLFNWNPTDDDDPFSWNAFNWPTPAPPCEGSTPNFEDEFGADCAFYEIVDQPGCPLYGDYFGGPMGTARDHCCYCQMEVPSSSPTLTNQPTTATRSPTLPNSTPTMDDDFMQWYSQFGGASEPPCEGNTPGWVDSVGDGCSWYEMFDAPGCPEEGDLYAGPMGTARENCCYCWMDALTSAPTVSSSPTLTPAPTAPVLCQGSTPSFKDSFGDGCDWYESSDEPGCPHHGHHYEGAMGVANDHCCYCKMSSSPTQTPPDIDGYEFKGHGFCTSGDSEDPFNDDPFDDGLFGFDIKFHAGASTLEECTSACAAEHSNDPLFRGVTWINPYECLCLKHWEWEEAGAGEITGATDGFGGALCYAFTSESTTESQESSATETPAEAISGLWGSLLGG